MTTSHSWKCFQVLFSLLILQFVSTTETTTETLKNDKAKVEFRNLSFPHLTESFFKPFNGNLALVKISECKIEKIDKRAFDGMKHLNFLEVSDSEIKDKIDSQTFSRVSTLEVLILKNVGLRDLNLNLTNVQELILSHNNIEDFKEDAIKGPNVNYLDVSNNKIEKLERGFRSMGKLSMIDISKNKIAHVGNGTFKHNHNLVRILASENQLKSTDGLKLPKLKTLDLFSNKITTLKSNAFEKMSFLEELVLAFNGIEIVEDPFKDLTELKFLNLAWNSIEQLPAGLFQNNLYLSHLSLQGNKLKSLTRFADSLDRLDKLDLSHNKIAYIEEEFFSAMPNLSILDLNFNGLKVLTNVFQPLKNLRVLNLAHNDIVLIGFEFSNNHLMTRLNLSSNNIDIGWGLFKNNTQLTSLDLSNNGISFFCDADVTLEKLRKINLSGNRNRDLGCLKGKNFQTLCQIDLRNNPLTCGKDLDDLILSFTMKKSSPYQIMKEIQLDAVQSQCQTLSLNQSLKMWNSVKRDLCPEGRDLQYDSSYWDAMEDDYSDESDEDSYAESFEEQTMEQAATSEKTKNFNIVRIGKLTKDISKDKKTSQSERVSWEQIDQNPDFANGFEEQEESKTHYNWYTIALVLIGISLSLTCFNLLVFLYVRLRIWRRYDANTPQKYTFLKNEVYRNTTEPTNPDQSSYSLWFPNDKLKNKIFSYGKVNEFFLNFGGKKDADVESTKNILISSNSNVQNC